jgi:hypothetical protein
MFSYRIRPRGGWGPVVRTDPVDPIDVEWRPQLSLVGNGTKLRFPTFRFSVPS